jgi:hypothetical protein
MPLSSGEPTGGGSLDLMIVCTVGGGRRDADGVGRDNGVGMGWMRGNYGRRPHGQDHSQRI